MSPTAWSVLFLVIGLVLIGLEAFVPGGILGAVGAGFLGGAVAGLIFHTHFWLAFTLGFAAVALIAVVLLARLYSRSEKTVSVPVGSEAILGKEATVIERTGEGSPGKVRLASGEVWSASSQAPIEVGVRVTVERLEGVRAVVRPVAAASPTSSEEG